MTTRPQVLVLVLVLALVMSPSFLLAHHSTMVFDITTPIRLKGTIVRVLFSNPHSVILVDVAGEDGVTTRWGVENSSTLAMTRQRGYDEQLLQAGDPIEACGYAPKQAFIGLRESLAPGEDRPASWWGDAEKVITGRFLLLKDGPGVHWSHYGPIELCTDMSEDELAAVPR